MTEDEIAAEPGRREILEQLERIVGSSLFRNSKRYPALLRYIVDEVLAGRGDTLKERTLGIGVFGRDSDYDTNADPVVRISAGEVRKRIAQYYQERGRDHELRIEIPLGSYQPRFYRPFVETIGVHPEREECFPALTNIPPAPAEPAGGLPAPALLPSAVEPATTLLSIPLPVKARGLSTLRHGPGRLHVAVLYTFLLLAFSALFLLGWQAYQNKQLSPGATFFWNKLLRSPEPTLIVLGVHSFDDQGNDISYRSHLVLPQTRQTLLSAMTRSDMVHLSDLTSYAKLTTLLAGHRHSFHTQGAADTTLEQLRQQPFILVGGFNNLWTTKLTGQLRFRFVTLEGGHNVIQDSRHPERTWTLDTSQAALSNTRDYGLVSCFLDPESDQYVLMVAGIGKSGTEAASDFVTNEREMTAWLKSATTQSGDNLQVVIYTDVIEGKPGSPHVVDFVRW